MDRVQRMQLTDRIARTIFLICAILLILVILSVFYFVGSNGIKFFFDKGAPSVGAFFTGSNWDPFGAYNESEQHLFGSLGLILGSVVLTLISVLIATPLAFGLALFLVEVAPQRVRNAFQPILEIFVGVPSVVIGFLGLTILVPFLQRLTAPLTGNNRAGGYGWGAAIIVLVVMILPTIASVSMDALRAVPGSVREASLSLGSTRWQMMSKAVLPAASVGLATAVVLGMARAIGETLAVSMVLGGYGLPSPLLSPQAFFQPSTNITRAIVQDFAESYSIIRDGYWMLAFVLLGISFLFICVSRYLASRSVYK